MKTEKVNILEQWKRHFDDLSSAFNPNRQISRESVEYVYDRLKTFWGADFFIQDNPYPAHRQKLHFIVSMLASIDESSFYYVIEVAVLLDFAREQRAQCWEKLQTVKTKSAPCKDLLFELWIDYTMNKNSVAYIPDDYTTVKPKDGYCFIGDERFLVECKKRYSIINEEVELNRYLMSVLLKTVGGAPYGFEAIGIFIIKTQGSNKEMYGTLLQQFRTYLKTNTSYDPACFFENEYASLELRPYEEALKVELDAGLKPASIYFVIRNQQRIVEANKYGFRIVVFFRIAADGRKVAKKLLDTIQKARKQHKGDEGEGRIFFIDNELLKDFDYPLLRDNGFATEVQQYVDSKPTRDIIVLIFRHFHQATPSIQVAVFSKPELSHVKQQLESLNYRNIDMRTVRI